MKIKLKDRKCTECPPPTGERGEREMGLKMTVLAENGSTDPDRRLFTTGTETPVDGFRVLRTE